MNFLDSKEKEEEENNCAEMMVVLVRLLLQLSPAKNIKDIDSKWHSNLFHHILHLSQVT